MSRFNFAPGSRALLFDRLAESQGPSAETASNGRDESAARRLDEADLRASVRRELADLLNTRAPVPVGVLEQRTRSTIDYGIPDLSVFPVGEHDATTRLAMHMRRAILAYEPRLSDPVIEIARGVGSAETISILVRGALTVGMMRVPVVFSLSLGGAAADVHAN
ncbi:MAG TPA: type VI secretion system baseplate subunit TssE [Candidatus Binataceae bacterium]|nr:type VI secretion system baseplate subunit TssE [Candidatus Binataceae bacterium]